jgi:hypothetical protein
VLRQVIDDTFEIAGDLWCDLDPCHCLSRLGDGPRVVR